MRWTPAGSPSVHLPDSWARLPIPFPRDRVNQALAHYYSSRWAEQPRLTSFPTWRTSSNCSSWKGKELLLMGEANWD